MVLDHRQNHLGAVRQAIGTAVYPLQVIVDSPFRLWEWARDSTADRDQLQLELSRLQAERLLTNARLQRMTALEAENARLRDLLEARAQVRDEMRVAEIMAVDANPYRHNIVIDIGEREGAYDWPGHRRCGWRHWPDHRNRPDIRRRRCSSSDPSHALPVEVNRNGLRTIANGTGEVRPAGLPFVANNADIAPGDLLVTSGLGGAFPAGYPVAIIDSGKPNSARTVRRRDSDAVCGARPGA